MCIIQSPAAKKTTKPAAKPNTKHWRHRQNSSSKAETGNCKHYADFKEIYFYSLQHGQLTSQMQIQVWDKTPGKAETISATSHKYNSQACAEKKGY